MIQTWPLSCHNFFKIFLWSKAVPYPRKTTAPRSWRGAQRRPSRRRARVLCVAHPGRRMRRPHPARRPGAPAPAGIHDGGEAILVLKLGLLCAHAAARARGRPWRRFTLETTPLKSNDCISPLIFFPLEKMRKVTLMALLW